MVLASSLALDGSKDDSKGWRDVGRAGHGGEATLADMFDYVCHGKLYKFEDGDESGQTMRVITISVRYLLANYGAVKHMCPSAGC